MRNMNDILRQAQVMQHKIAKLQQDAAVKTFEATSGGGMVTAVVTGKQELKTLTIDPKALEEIVWKHSIVLCCADNRHAGYVCNELADRLSCAPSQISYVLSTRFTPEKGYLVESRRGSGGFIRIVRILPVEEQQEEPTVDEILHYWHENRMLTDREFELLHYLMSIMDIPEREKRQILRQAVKRMVDAS